MPVVFHTENVPFVLKHKAHVRHLISACLREEQKKLGPVNVIFCTDAYLYAMNNKYLHHNYYTDVITFDHSDDKETIAGDIFISVDRVKENAVTYKTEFDKELQRVILHGILHLIGYKDNTAKEKALMRKKEEYYLALSSSS